MAKNEQYAVGNPKDADLIVSRLVRDVNSQLAKISDRFRRLGIDGGTLTGDLNVSRFRITNVGSPLAANDVITIDSLSDALDDIEDEAVSDETSESDDAGSTRAGGRRRARRSSARRRVAAEAAAAVIANALPDAAPPKVDNASNIGTTTDPAQFALEDHTHQGVNLDDTQTISGTKTTTPGFIFTERTAPANPAADNIHLYAFDLAGTTVLQTRDSAGNTVTLGGFSVVGVAGQVAFFATPTTLAGDNNLFWNNSTKRFGVGTNAPIDDVEFFQDGGILNFYFGDTSSTGPTVTWLQGRGTRASTTATQSGDTLADNLFKGHHGTAAWGTNSIWAAGIAARAEENFTSTACGTSIRFYNATIGSSGTAERMRLEAAEGNLLIGTTTNVTGTRLRVIGGSTECLTVYGGTATSDDITIKPHNNAFGITNTGRVAVIERTELFGNLGTVALGANTFLGVDIAPSTTFQLDNAGSVLFAVNLAGNIEVTTTPAVGSTFFRFAPTITHKTNNQTVIAANAFTGQPFQVSDGIVTTLSDIAAVVQAIPNFNVANGGTYAAGGVVNCNATGGTVGAGATIDEWNHFRARNITGAGTIGIQRAFYIAGFGKGTTNITLESTSAATMRHNGAATFGLNAAPIGNERLRVHQATITNEVVRIESAATNDDPNYRIFQGRVTTTDATVTTLMSFTLTAANAYLIEARVVAHRTGGAAGAADDSAAYVVYAGAKHTGGVAALINAVGAAYTDEDQAGWNATIDVDGANAIRVRVTGAANNDIVWHCTLIVQNVST